MNAVRSIVAGLLCLAGVAQGADLPVKYLAYVEATGSQYVDTGFVPNGNTKIEATYQLTALESQHNYVFGVYGANGSGRCQFSPAAKTYAGFGDGYSDSITWQEDTAWHTVEMNKGTFKVDGNQIYSRSFAGASKNLFLFAVNANGTAADFATDRISLVKIYDNGVLKRLMVPCEMSDGRVGFWDFVTGAFYGDRASGNFVGGAEVSPLERLEYVRFANGTYVDTGVVPADHETAIRFRDEKSAAGGYLFGGANNNQWLYSFTSSGASWTWGYSGTASRSYSGYTPNVDHTLVFNDMAGGRVYMDGLDMGKGMEETPTSRLYLGRRYNVYNYEGRIYWVKVTARTTGDLALWLEPMRVCGTVGFYDPAAGKLLLQGAGTLSAGPLQAGQFEIAGQRDFTVEGMTPACGLYEDVAVGAEIAVSAPAETVIAPELKVTCTGWKLYEWDDEAMGWVYNEGRANASGSGTSFTYVHTGVATKLEWQWSFANPVAAGDERYVAEFGDDAADGTSWATAKKTVQAAIDAAPDYGKVLAAPGLYHELRTAITADNVIHSVYLTRPVSVIGVAGPALTTVDAGLDTARAGAKVTHAEALLTGFSFVNCAHKAKARATGVEADAGMVSNCVVDIRAHDAYHGTHFRFWGTSRGYDLALKPKSIGSNETSSFIYLYGDSVVDGLTVTGMKYTGNDLRHYVWLSGNAVLRNALIADNEQGSYEIPKLYPMVCLDSATCRLEDSTIVNNYIYSQDGVIQVNSAKAVVTNTIVYFNSSKNAVNKDIHNGVNKARFLNCCSTELAGGEANGNIVTDPQFVDAANGDYRLRSLSQAKEMGATWLRPAGGVAQFECAGDADTYVSASGEPLEATFTGYCAGEQGEVTALWDFGDGTTSTDWPSTTHTYKTPGAYTVTLTLNDGVSAPAVYTFAKSLVCMPETCYMSTTGSNTYPYDTWEKATPSLQAALDVGSSKIVVTNGNYEIPAPVIGISRAVTITSVEGPEKTTFTSLGTTTCDHRNLTVSSSDAILISGLTFADGYAANYGWTASIEMSAGVVSNCVFKNIRRVSRSAACYFYGTAKAVDCVFDGHGMGWNNDSATQSGVRIEESAVLDRCEIFAFKIENNYESSGYDGESPVRIASANAVLRNSYVHHCTNGVPTSANVKNRGPIGLINGRIENCTIVNNVCAGYGGGVWAIGGTVVNSIIWDNKAGMAGNDVYVRGSATPKFLYSCASDFEAGAAITGEGCTAKAPNFDTERPYHLTPLSTASLNTGTNLDWMTAGAVDKDRLPRVVRNGEIAEDGVDMGCFEYQESTLVPLDGTIDVVGAASGRAPFTATLEASIVGDEQGLALVWDFGDGESVAGGKRVTHTYEEPGSYTVTVHASNGAAEEKDIAATAPVVVVPQVCYVSKEGKGIAPYMTWENAATNLHDAVELNPKTVFVSNGLYKISREICIQSDLELRSVNGPEVTIVDAGGACRNLWMTDQAEGAVVDGFSLWRGAGNWDAKSNYARVEAGTLSNCILSNSYGSVYRDSAVLVKGKGRMSDCVVDNAGMGGNADCTHFFGTVVQSGGVIERCTIQRYIYTNQGGASGTHGAVHVEGTGVFRNCLVKDCVTTQVASGEAKRAAVLVSEQGVVENCTIVNSKSCQPGAGLTILSGTPTVRNCIVWGATLGDGMATTAVRVIGTATPRITYSCAPELTAGEGNTTADPQFRAKSGVPYRFGSGSPCYDSAQKLDWMDESAVDRLGNVRIYSVAPDMGCYESLSGGLKLIVR